MSIMTKGIIGMPYTIAMNSEMSRRQFYSHAQVLLAENDRLKADLDSYKQGAQVEADAGDEARAEVRQLKAENDELRATADLQKLLPEISDALEDLELHGLHGDQGYRKLKDWYRKIGLAYRVIQGPMFGAEHGELVSQNTWLRSIVEHYAQQHAPLEPIPDSDGWSTRLPGYDLPALLMDAERYRWLRDSDDAAPFLSEWGIRQGEGDSFELAVDRVVRGEEPWNDIDAGHEQGKAVT